MRLENPPFERGATFYNGGTIDANNLGGPQMVGTEWEFEDLLYNQPGQVGAKAARTNRKVRCRIVRNVSGVNILPKQLVTFQKTGSDGRMYGAHVDGLVAVGADRCYPADEFLPAAGVPNNDLFYIVVAGPALVLTPLDGGADNVVNVGDPVVGLTAATSGATTAGRATAQVISAATTANVVNASNTMNVVGRALSAVTTGQTGANLLVEVGKW